MPEASGPLARVPASILESIDRGEAAPVLVRVDPLAERGHLLGALGDGFEVLRRYARLPLLALRMGSRRVLERLVGHPATRGVHEDRVLRTQVATSLPLIAHPAAAAAGMHGTGTAVAVIDTGIDYRHAAFGSCTAPGQPAGCRVAATIDIAPDDGALDDMGHGTNVAAVVSAVAPGAKLVALDVFRPGGFAFASDVLGAIDWVLEHRAAYNIVAMNLSLGGGASSSPCAGDVFADALAQARAAGVLAAVAAGNEARSDALSYPACAPAAISVGAVYSRDYGRLRYDPCTDPATAADEVACFSNAASFLTLFAPGALISAGGYTMAGTSQAAPHVAGALAVLRSAFPEESLDQTVARIAGGGASVRDKRTGLIKPRLDLSAAISRGPVGSLSIAGGAAATRDRAVTLRVSAQDSVPVLEICIGEQEPCGAWQPLRDEARFTLSAGDGPKRLFARFRNTLGVVSRTPATATIVLDTVAPADGSAAATRAGSALSVVWSGFADAHSGIAAYRVSIGTSPPATCSEGAPLYEGPGASAREDGLDATATYFVRVCAIDAAGNESPGVLLRAPAPSAGRGPAMIGIQPPAVSRSLGSIFPRRMAES